MTSTPFSHFQMLQKEKNGKRSNDLDICHFLMSDPVLEMLVHLEDEKRSNAFNIVCIILF